MFPLADFASLKSVRLVLNNGADRTTSPLSSHRSPPLLLGVSSWFPSSIENIHLSIHLPDGMPKDKSGELTSTLSSVEQFEHYYIWLCLARDWQTQIPQTQEYLSSNSVLAVPLVLGGGVAGARTDILGCWGRMGRMASLECVGLIRFQARSSIVDRHLAQYAS